MAILTHVKWYLTEVFIFISLMTRDTKHPFIFFWALCVFILEKCLFTFFAHFFNWVACLPWVESCEFFIYFGDLTLVWNVIGKYIFPYGWLPFHFADVYFSFVETFSFDEVRFVDLFLYAPCFRGHISENIAPWNSKIFLSMFCSRIFMLLRLTFKSFLHHEFISLYGLSWCIIDCIIEFHCFAFSCWDLTTPFVEEVISYSILCSCHLY